MFKLQCSKCDYIKTYFETEIIRDEQCELCGNRMELLKKESEKTIERNRANNEIGENCPSFNKEEYTPEEAVKVLTKAQMYDYIKKAVKRYGLEGTEEVIKRVYNTAPKLQEQMLQMLYEIWKGL